MQGEDFKKRDSMSFDGFCTCVKIDIQHMLPGARVIVQKVVKNNGTSKQGLIIMENEGNNVTPTIYLESFYQSYLDGRRLEWIVQDILTVYQMHKPLCDFDPEDFRDWNWAKKRIVCRLVNGEMNRENLDRVPHVPYLDLAVTFACFVESELLGDDASIPIYNSHLKMWGITVGELYAIAMKNTQRLLPPIIQEIREVIVSMGVEVDSLSAEEQSAGRHMYVLYNKKRNYGAVYMLYKDVLKGFADRMGSDLYILPSSVGELILIPTWECGNPAGLRGIVRIMNVEQLCPEEILSDNVYRFIRQTGEITIQEEEV